MATVYYTAASLDGFVVDTDDSLDWLTSRAIDQAGPFGYDEFIAAVGAVVMGRAPTSGSSAISRGVDVQPAGVVLTHRPEIVAPDHPVRTFAGDAAGLHPTLVEAAAGKDVWVIGGGEAAAQFVAAGLVDEMIVSYAPCSLGAGARVLPLRSEWALVESGVNGDFVCARWRRAA